MCVMDRVVGFVEKDFSREERMIGFGTHKGEPGVRAFKKWFG